MGRVRLPLTRPRSPEVLVQVRNLHHHFTQGRSIFRQSRLVRAVDGVSLDIHRGETLGLIGESGSGKSTLGRCILHLLKPTSGTVQFESILLQDLAPEALRQLRRNMQMVFQDPFASLNPRLTVGSIVTEPLQIHRLADSRERREIARELLQKVGLSRDCLNRYPHEFSGGQRQRIGIARALATHPSFIVADEPISALDVSIQAQVVNLLSDLKEEFGLTYLLIAHDLSMVHYLCDRVAVMYLGRLVEIGSREEVFQHPLHPYTRALIASVPVPDPGYRPPLELLNRSAELPNPANPPGGCRFHPRCPLVSEICRHQDPALEFASTSRQVACHHALPSQS